MNEWRRVGPGRTALIVALARRHGVILRKLSLSTRTPVGSRVVARLASVIDTCRQCGQAPWRYLERAIADRRAGLPLAPLPQPGG